MNRFVSNNAGSKQEKIRLRSLGTRMIHLFVIIVLQTHFHEAFVLHPLQSVSLSCVLQLQSLDQFLASDKLEANVIHCACDCITEKATQIFSEAMRDNDTHKKQCEERVRNRAGQCVEKLQEHLDHASCSKGITAHCLIDCKARTVYEVTVAKLLKILKRLVIDKNETIWLELNETTFVYENKMYELNDIMCDQPPGRYFISFKNRETNYQWLETFNYSEHDVKLMKRELFVLSNGLENVQNHQSLIHFNGTVCNNDNSSVVFTFTTPPRGNGSVIWSNLITAFNVIDNITTQIYYRSKRAVNRVKKTTTAKLTENCRTKPVAATLRFSFGTFLAVLALGKSSSPINFSGGTILNAGEATLGQYAMFIAINSFVTKCCLLILFLCVLLIVTTRICFSNVTRLE